MGAVLAAWPGGMAPAAAQASSLVVEADTSYRLDVGAGVVHATVEAELTNTAPPRVEGDVVETPYYDTYAVPVYGPVADVTARSSVGGSLSTSIEQLDARLSLLHADLSPDLVHGRPQTVTFEFDLPAQPTRSASSTRINDAYASFVAIGVGDPQQATIRIDVPARYEPAFGTSGQGRTTITADRRVHELGPFADRLGAAFLATWRDEEHLEARRVTVDGIDVTVQGWPGDRQWAGFAARTVEEGLPLLQRLLGQDLPDRELTIAQTSGGQEQGFAGFYDQLAHRIEVGEALDDQVLLHELGHVWLNDQLFTDRWITEGLAELLANRALRSLDGEPTPPEPVDHGAPGAVRLADWTLLPLSDQRRAEVEAFGYGASYAVMDALVDDMGLDGLRDVIAAAAADEITYRGDPATESMRAGGDWRWFLDLVELVGGVEDARGLFEEHVVPRARTDQLDQRAQAQERLARLTAAGEGWTAPLQVRQRMARWRFDDARVLMAQAHDLLDRLDALRDDVAGLDADPTPMLEPDYESAEDLDDLEQTIAELEQVGERLVAVHARRDDAGPLATLGLLGTDHLAAADRAYGAADLDAARAALDAAAAALDDAPRRALAGLAVAGLLVLVVARRVRARRRRRATARA